MHFILEAVDRVDLSAFKVKRTRVGKSQNWDKNRRVPNRKNRVDKRIEQRICEMAIDNPALEQVRVSNELRKEGLPISPGGVRSVS